VKLLALTFVKEQGPDGKVFFAFPGGRVRVTPFEAARHQANEWHLHELGLLLQRLKSLPEVRDMLGSWGSCQGMESSNVTAAAVIAWWLHHVCPSCHGGRYELLPGTDTRSSRICKTCKGTGSTKVPFAADGAAMVAEIEVALHGATCSMGASMRNRSRPSHGDS
jgi:hypothetical protein